MAEGPQNLSEVVTELPEPITCHSRINQFGPWEHKEGLDHWLQHKNGDRVCSFCGSLHPQDFQVLVKKAVAENSEISIEPSDKPYKVYVNRPDVKNAMEGGIKFYGWHLEHPATEEEHMEYRDAVLKSKRRFQRKLKL